ncbi:MAG TPA: hypothetical protein VIP46_10155 [Pyrinomonadaceae bacterium]
MVRRKRLALLLVAVAALLCGARDALACSRAGKPAVPDLPCMCPKKPTVLEAYDRSGVVVIARVASIVKPKVEEAAKAEEPEEEPADEEQQAEGEKKSGEAERPVFKRWMPQRGWRGDESRFEGHFTKMIVERSYKGDLKAGDEMVFSHGLSGCDWSYFVEDDIGRRILLYLPAPGKDHKPWRAGGCGRGGDVQHVGDDLLFLNNLAKARGRTRLSGTVASVSGEHARLANRTVRVVGAKKTYEAKTDENGVYEIYDLPAGRYLVEPETQPGWKIDADSSRRSPSFADVENVNEIVSGGRLKRIPVVVEDKRHAGVDIYFEIDNAVGGKVYNAAGKPMRDVCLRIHPAAGEQQAAFPYKANCTKDDGAFLFEEIPTGSYVLVVNEDGKITSSEPFGKFYYPNVAERERAAVITVGPGDRVTGLDIHPPGAVETITVEGRFLYSDGQPVVGESVEFNPEKYAGDVEGRAEAHTDTAGRFSLKILKGLRGQLHGVMGLYYGKFDNCPKLEATLKRIAPNYVLKTPALTLGTDADLREVELRYPFPSCQKERDQE